MLYEAELNSQLYFKINAIKASQTQDKYIAVDLFFKLAVNRNHDK